MKDVERMGLWWWGDVQFYASWYSAAIKHLCGDKFSLVQSLSHVRLFATLWTAARQASLSITNSWSSLRLTSIESVMPTSHLILYCPLLLLSPIPPKNWCLWTVVLEKTLESPLDNKEIKSVNPKGNQPWIFIVRTNAEAEAPILQSPNAKSWLIGKTLMRGKTEGKRSKGWQVWNGWMASLTQWTWVWANSGSEGQGSLACCSPWDRKESDITKWLNKIPGSQG